MREGAGVQRVRAGVEEGQGGGHPPAGGEGGGLGSSGYVPRVEEGVGGWGPADGGDGGGGGKVQLTLPNRLSQTVR